MTPLGLGAMGSVRSAGRRSAVVSALETHPRADPNASSIEPMGAAIGMQLTTVVGPMARRIADLRAAFEVLAGPTWRDPWTVPTGPWSELSMPVRVALVVDPAG